MKMLFPESEVESLNSRLEKDLPIYTIRVSTEYKKYKVGETYTSNLKLPIRIIGEEFFTNISHYPFYDELNKYQIDTLLKYSAYHMLKLIGVQDHADRK